MNETTKFIDMAKRHRDQDMLDAGSFEMKNGKACSVGCFNAELGNKPSDFAALAKATGYHEAAHRLQEAIFEGLPQSDRLDWHVQFFEKAATVTDWDRVMQLTTLAALKIAEPHDTSANGVVAKVIGLYERLLNGDNPSGQEWADAWEAAWAVARVAARVAECNVGLWAAARAAEGGGAARDDAAWAAWAAVRAAKGNSWRSIRDAFLRAE